MFPINVLNFARPDESTAAATYCTLNEPHPKTNRQPTERLFKLTIPCTGIVHCSIPQPGLTRKNSIPSMVKAPFANNENQRPCRPPRTHILPCVKQHPSSTHAPAVVPLSVMFSNGNFILSCLLYTSPSPRDQRGSRMPSSA